MTVAYDLTHRGSGTPQSTTGTALEDRFEILKDIGDGSFGSVVLARVRSAGSNVARRGTVVSTARFDLVVTKADPFNLDCDQDYEEELRILRAMSRTPRSRLPQNAPSSSPPSPSVRYLLGSFQQEAPYRHGIYGWQSISVDEGQGPQMP